MKKGNKGFTLVEIVVVLVILGIMAAAYIPSALGQVERANEAIDIENMQLAVKCARYYIFENKFEQGTLYYWDVVTGDFVEEKPAQAYGRGKETDGGAIYYLYDNHHATINQVICVHLNDSGDFEMEWVD